MTAAATRATELARETAEIAEAARARVEQVQADEVEAELQAKERSSSSASTRVWKAPERSEGGRGDTERSEGVSSASAGGGAASLELAAEVVEMAAQAETLHAEVAELSATCHARVASSLGGGGSGPRSSDLLQRSSPVGRGSGRLPVLFPPFQSRRREIRYQQAVARIRFLARVEPWRDEQVVVAAARQMRRFGKLLRPDGDVALTWADVNLVIRRDDEVRGTGKNKNRAAGGGGGGITTAWPPSSLSSAGPIFSSTIPSPMQPYVAAAAADRGKYLAATMAAMGVGEQLAALGDQARERFVENLRAVERNRAGISREFAAEMREAEIPRHDAADRLEAAGRTSDAELRRAATQQPGAADDDEDDGGETGEAARARRVGRLAERMCQYNCEAMRRVIDRIVKAQLAGLMALTVVEVEREGGSAGRGGGEGAAATDEAFARYRAAAREAFGAVDYLNQGMIRVSRNSRRARSGASSAGGTGGASRATTKL